MKSSPQISRRMLNSLVRSKLCAKLDIVPRGPLHRLVFPVASLACRFADCYLAGGAYAIVTTHSQSAGHSAKSPLIAWPPFCLRGIRTQGRPKGPPPEAVPIARCVQWAMGIPDFEFLSGTVWPCNQ